MVASIFRARRRRRRVDCSLCTWQRRRRRATKPYPEPAQPATENGRLENDGMTDRKGWTKRQHRGPISRDASDGFYRTVSCWRAFSALPPPPPQTGQRYSRSHAEPGQRVRQQQQQQHCFSSQHPPSAPPSPAPASFTRSIHALVLPFPERVRACSR